MNRGCPPTAPKARAGLLTPPGITPQARSKACRLRTRSVFMVSSRGGGCIRGVAKGHGRRRGLSPATLEEALGLFDLILEVGIVRVEGQDVHADGAGELRGPRIPGLVEGLVDQLHAVGERVLDRLRLLLQR